MPVVNGRYVPPHHEAFVNAKPGDNVADAPAAAEPADPEPAKKPARKRTKKT